MAERVETTIERFVPGGWGLGRDGDGLIFVRGAAHEETVRAVVVKKKGAVRFAIVEEVVARGSGRGSSDCDGHPRCGGCALLDLTPESEVKAKTQMLHDALGRLAKLTAAQLALVHPLKPAPKRAGARIRTKFVIDESGAPAFHEELTPRTVPRAACVALHPALGAVLAQVYDEKPWPAGAQVQAAVDLQGRRSAAVLVPQGGRAAARMAERLVKRGIVNGAIALAAPGRSAASFGDPVLQGVVAPGVGGGPYFSDAATFTQATDFGGKAILLSVQQAAKKLGFENGRVLELYAGAGHLTLGLAGKGAKVVAVESDRQAITWLRSNAHRSPAARNIEVKEYFVEGANIAEILGSHTYDAMVIDPPRAGVKSFAALLNTVAPTSLVMVSCDLATGARDLRVALDHGYRLHGLLPIDAFPRTHHLEWVAMLQKQRFLPAST
jgi:23S rRNA (uracil1939-C5)-methyltransferase